MRAQQLGSFGEKLAETILLTSGFINIKNLNQSHQTNFPFGDLYAERKNENFVISVKIRNKHEANTGKLNSRYNLGRRCNELAESAQIQLSAIPAFLAISLLPNSYSAYFAPLSILDGGRGIPMTPSAVARYKCLANNVLHNTDISHLKNIYSLRAGIVKCKNL